MVVLVRYVIACTRFLDSPSDVRRETVSGGCRSPDVAGVRQMLLDVGGVAGLRGCCRSPGML